MIEVIMNLLLRNYVHLMYASDITHRTGLNALCHLPQIDRVFEEAKRFFSLPQDLKSKYRRTANSNNNGYVALLGEK